MCRHPLARRIAGPGCRAALKLTSRDLLKLDLIDAIVPEPVGGAHRNVHDTVHSVESYIARTLTELRRLTTEELLESRYRKWRSIGAGCASRVERKAARIVATSGATSGRRSSSTATV